MKNFTESVNHGVERILNQVKMHGLQVDKVHIRRDKDVRIDYSVYLINQEGTLFHGMGTAIRNVKKGDKFNKQIGHQVAYSRALKQALSVASAK